MKKIIFGLLMICTVSAHAGYQVGQITQILVRQNDGLHYFFMSGTPIDRPVCAADQTYWMIKDENSAIGKAQLSMLLTAYASGKTVGVVGHGTCARWPDGEDLDVIHLK